jgi:glucosylceramidase
MKRTLKLTALFLVSICAVTAQTKPKVYYVDLKDSQNSGKDFVKEYTPQEVEKKGRIRTIKLYPNIEFQKIDGVGGAFNEIGGEALMSLPAKLQDEVMQNIFGKDGAAFSFCRTAVGASDFGIDAYSYSEVPDDYEMKHFSIEREEKTVIPFIQKAYRINPELLLFASPWSPPAWMKYSGLMDRGEEFPDKNHLKDEPKIYEAYALYFSKYISAYSKKNIKVDRLVVQNENDANTPYPSCVMPPEQMGKFVKEYLKPQFEADKIETEIWAGTFRTHGQLDALEFAANKQYIDAFDGIGIQYTAQQYIQDLKSLVPQMKIMHTEGRCEDGKNNEGQAAKRLDEIAGYINYGVTNYCYWNMILNETTESGWDWKQNSLINIDRQNKTVQYNPDFTVMALISKYLQPGTVRIANSAPTTVITVKKDGKVFILVQNNDDTPKIYNCQLANEEPFELQLPANSLSAVELTL